MQLRRQYGRRTARVRAISGIWGVVWPASFPGAPRARSTAHALAVLVLVTAVCGAYIAFYWADDPQADSQSRVDVLTAGRSTMTMATYWLLVTLAGPAAKAVTPLLILRTALMNDSDYCTALVPTHPLSGRVLPISVLVALAAGSAATWIMSVLSPRRARPAAQTCDSEAGARGISSSAAGKQPW